AKNIILVAGDSITHWGLGNDPDGFPYNGKDLYASRLSNYLNNLGYPTRVINKGIRGSMSREGKFGLIDGYYDGIDFNLLIVGYGTNDGRVSTALTTDEVKSNLRSFITWRNTYHPGRPILFLAPGSMDKTDYFENVASYRTAVQQAATDAAFGGGTANKVYYYDASTAFGLGGTPANDVNFQTPERSANNRLHWSGAGHKLVADAIWANTT
ncbi:SGNH/GDSL hydrolase family protein, partial [Larkinella ripae]